MPQPIAAARTCYSPRVIERTEITDKQRDSIGPLTFDGGHHTVFQHAHFEFGLENISRQLRDDTFCRFLKLAKSAHDIQQLLEEADNNQFVA